MFYFSYPGNIPKLYDSFKEEIYYRGSFNLMAGLFTLLFDAMTGKSRLYTIDDFYSVHQVLNMKLET